MTKAIYKTKTKNQKKIYWGLASELIHDGIVEDSSHLIHNFKAERPTGNGMSS